MPQLYARVFIQILDSSVAEDWRVRHVFEDVLKLANSEGVLDMTREAFSRRTNTPLDIVNMAIDRLEQSDRESRDPSEDGKRLVRLDDHRTWGWRVVNWQKYDRIRTSEDNRIRQQRFYWKTVTPPHTPPRGKDKDPDTDTTPGVKRHLTVPNSDLLGDPVQQAQEIYGLYPRKVGKPVAIRAIIKSLHRFGFDHIKAKTQQFSESQVGADPQFIPHPSTWFNQERFNDDPSTWVRGQPKQASDAQKILQSKELERVEAKIKQIKDSAGQDAMGLILTDTDRAELKILKARRQELIQALGMSA